MRSIAVLALVLSIPFLLSCAGGTPEPAAGAGRDDDRATNLLERARASKDPERYRRLLSRFPDTRAAADGRDELATLLVIEAQKYLTQGDLATADDRAEEARLYAGVDNTEKVRAIQKQVDEGRATKIGKKAIEAASAGKCASALKQVADALRGKPRPHMKDELIKQTQDSLVGCLSQKVSDEAKAGNVESARAQITTPDAAIALSKPSFTKIESTLQKVLVEQSTAEIKPLLSAEKWPAAFSRLDELKQAGKLSESEYPIAVGIVQDAIRARLLEQLKSAIASAKPAEAAQKIDEVIAAARWKKVPDEVAGARRKLATAIQCEKVKCKLGRPTPAWAWGRIPLRPADGSPGEETELIAHAQKVWVLAKSTTNSLIATADPGDVDGAALFEKAAGWINPKNLRPTDTELWLPPDDQLTGVMVWAPLRAPSKDYHLGTVKKLDGKKVTVERLGDKAEVTVDLASIRVGKLSQGLKVKAFCVDQVQTEPAKVDSVVSTEAGIPKVKIVCEKGDITRIDVASALVSRAEWLPARKP